MTAIYGGFLLYKESGVHRPDQVVAALRRVR